MNNNNSDDDDDNDGDDNPPNKKLTNNNKYNFNEIDNDDLDGDIYINEDDQEYCSYRLYQNGDETIPTYSRSLWNQCLELLKTNTTITNLSIGNVQCGLECFARKTNEEDMPQQMMDDLLNSLSCNQSIKHLTLNTLNLWIKILF